MLRVVFWSIHQGLHAHYSSGEEVEFASLDVHMSMEEIYRDINFDEPLMEE